MIDFMKHNSELLSKAAEELRVAMERGDKAEVTLTPFMAFNVAAALQLALRHPGVPVTVRESVRITLQALEIVLVAVGPSAHRIFEMGNDARFDYRRGQQAEGN